MIRQTMTLLLATAAFTPALASDVDSATTTDANTIVVTGTQYKVDAVSSGTKTDMPLLETPMAIAVVPKDVIRDRLIRTALDAVRNVSGVQSPGYQFYDQFMIRGFDSGYGATFRNGLQMQGINEAVNMAFVEHIEVVKGPTSMLYGRVEPGGFVNVVTRSPQEDAAYSASIQGGRWDFLRASVDATGKVSADGTLSYRLMGDYDRSKSWVNYAHRDNLSLSGSFAWKPGDRFSARLDIEYYDHKKSWLDASVPVVDGAPAKLPRSFSILYPQAWSDYPYRIRRLLVAFNWTYQLADNWKITNRFHHVRGRENQQGVYLDGFDGVDSFTATRFTHSGPGWIRKSIAGNLDLAGEFATGGIGHKLLIGVDYARFSDFTPGSTGAIDGAVPVNIYNPVLADYSAILRVLAAQDAGNILWADKAKDLGVYFQDQIALTDRIDLLLSGRYDWARDAYPNDYGSRDSACYPNCTASPLVRYSNDKAFSPRAALLFRIDPHNSIYASYSKSFGTSNGPDADGRLFPAQRGRQYEIGYKTSLLNGKLTGSVTLFTLTKSNIPQYDPVDFFPHIVGAARSRGIELDIAGQVTRHFSVIGSYTYDRAKISKDLYNDTLGNVLSNVAPHVFNLWGKYESNPTGDRSLSLGAGLYASSGRWGNDENSWRLKGYSKVDAMIAWRMPFGGTRMTAQVNINNLFDKRYFEHGSYNMASYGAPRSVMASLSFDY